MSPPHQARIGRADRDDAGKLPEHTRSHGRLAAGSLTREETNLLIRMAVFCSNTAYRSNSQATDLGRLVSLRHYSRPEKEVVHVPFRPRGSELEATRTLADSPSEGTANSVAL
ncbi:hypothetical protein WOLCODRAFT_156018 [Wolfiporia cocos MD-104 SS10]|uniref:Uncharacterized protein n=1 Tax=Wolfiporia cocos (strain MD-104) TaxID=742152 RepID=A0A2H3J6D1_WOLCO|nr:hypothetical protein WOLCODRAFT_156018 [Wolfiporia cocos MD-104 SS10]